MAETAGSDSTAAAAFGTGINEPVRREAADEATATGSAVIVTVI